MTAIEFSTQLVNYEYALKPFAYSLTKDTAEGEDLFQDTIYRALLYTEISSNQEQISKHG
jgi:DNA-directed RNA polymerase specialized sigma24 family protein